jgi:prophage regulatory protein
VHNTPSIAATTAANGAPAPNPKLPDTGFLRQPQVLAFVPISKSTLWRRVQARTFPEPVKLSERVTVWRVEDIRQWIAVQARGHRSGSSPSEG